MAVYVDNARITSRGKLWFHLVADSLTELHSFANALGLQRRWFQLNASYPHYDITEENRFLAISMGALEASRRQTIACARLLKKEHQKNIAKMEFQKELFPELAR